MKLEEVKKDLESVKGRTMSGRMMAQVIINYDELKDFTGFDIAEKFGLKPNTSPELSKAKAIAKQLEELGWKLQK